MISAVARILVHSNHNVTIANIMMRVNALFGFFCIIFTFFQRLFVKKCTISRTIVCQIAAAQQQLNRKLVA